VVNPDLTRGGRADIFAKPHDLRATSKRIGRMDHDRVGRGIIDHRHVMDVLRFTRERRERVVELPLPREHRDDD
jgi:hypothetical protein